MEVVTLSPDPSRPNHRIRQRAPSDRHGNRPDTKRQTTPAKGAEADVAAWLTAHNIIWRYEPSHFQFPDGTGFRPDFLLSSHQCYLEIGNTVHPAYLAKKRVKIGFLEEFYNKRTILIGPIELEAIRTGDTSQFDLMAAITTHPTASPTRKEITLNATRKSQSAAS